MLHNKNNNNKYKSSSYSYRRKSFDQIFSFLLAMDSQTSHNTEWASVGHTWSEPEELNSLLVKELN